MLGPLEDHSKEELDMSLDAQEMDAVKPSIYNGDDDDDDKCCRICRCGEEEDRPLFHPCICTGSIRYVHEECLMEWLSHIGSKSKSKCELCGHHFSFVPIYSPDTPQSLSPTEMLRICFIRMLKLIPTCVRVLVVALAWGVLVPFATCVWFRWMSLSGASRLSESLSSANEQPGWSPFWGWLGLAVDGGYYASWCTGMIVSVCIILSFLALLVVFDYVHGWNELRFDDLDEPVNADRNLNLDEQGNEGESDVDSDDDVNDINNNEENNIDNENDNNLQMRNENDRPRIGEDGFFARHPPAEEPAEDIGDANDIDIDRHEDEAIEINLALDEFVGMRGPILILLHNITCLIVFNCIYLCMLYYCPTTFGAVLLTGFNRMLNYSTGMTFLSEEDEVFLLRTGKNNVSRSDVTVLGDTETNSWVTVLGSESHYAQVIQQEESRTCSEKDAENLALLFNDRFHWSSLEVLSFSLGHISVACFFGLCLVLSRFFARYCQGNRIASTFWKRFSDVFETFGCTMKVAILVLIKMVLFPIGLGVLLERSCQSMFVYTIEDRYLFALERPIYAGMVFWVAGITHMLVITVMVVQLREVLHKDVLQGIIRAHDPNTNLWRILLVEPISNHIRRIVVSCAIYTMLVLLFVYTPLRIINNLEVFDKSWWPLRPTLNYYSLELQLPVELAIFHLVALHVLDYCKMNVFSAQLTFAKFACGIFGLTSYLLPCPDPSKVDIEEFNRPTLNAAGEIDMEKRRQNLLPRVKPSFASVRIAGLLVFSWAVCLVVAVCGVSLPYFVGSFMLKLLSIPLNHDPYVYYVGCLVLWRLGILIKEGSLNHLLAFCVHYARENRNSSLRNLVGCSQWLALAIGALVFLPWLMGVTLQIAFLISDDNPALIVAADGTNGWLFRKAFTGYISILLNSNVESDVGFLSFLYQVPKMVGNEWLEGVFVLVALEQMFSNRALATTLGVKAVAMHNCLCEAVEELKEYRCTKLLKNIVLPLMMTLILAISVSVFGGMFADFLVYSLTGASLCEIYGIALLFRKSLVLTATAALLPYVIMQARGTLSQLHDALRDEKYLVGRQLLNMEKRLKKDRSVM